MQIDPGLFFLGGLFMGLYGGLFIKKTNKEKGHHSMIFHDSMIQQLIFWGW